MAQQPLDGIELVARERWLASPIFCAVVIRLGVSNARFLGFLGNLRLCLGGRSHEGNQGIPDRLLHRVRGRAIEGHAIDDRLDANTPANKLPHGARHVAIITAQAVNPSDDQNITFPQNIEQTPSLGALAQAR